MKITLNAPRPFSEPGQKPNQEDRIAPIPMDRNTRCFVLCDGMGGHENGEVAAEIVATNLYKALTESIPEPDIISVERFNNALAATNAELDKMPIPDGKLPGTTMTCVYFAENGVLCAHIGDSRIYHIRPGVGIMYVSRDHSLVNDLLRAGQLTPEEAKTFPRKNVITRAMQPGLDRPYRADIKIFSDVKAGDYFFMCCDGILEQLTDERLVEIVNENTDATAKRQAVYDICFNRTRDNFTCIFIPVAEVVGEPLPTPPPPEPVWPTVAMAAPKPEDATTAVVEAPEPGHESTRVVTKPKSNNQPDKKSRLPFFIIIGVLVTVLVVLVVLLFKSKDSDKQESSKVKDPQEQPKADPKSRNGKNVQDVKDVIGNPDNRGGDGAGKGTDNNSNPATGNANNQNSPSSAEHSNPAGNNDASATNSPNVSNDLSGESPFNEVVSDAASVTTPSKKVPQSGKKGN